jgi:hypothetical protein
MAILELLVLLELLFPVTHRLGMPNRYALDFLVLPG